MPSLRLPRHPSRRPAARTCAGLVAVAALGTAVLTGCGSSSPSASQTSTASTGATTTTASTGAAAKATYVAMGDSYAAAPILSPADPSGAACLRSGIDYAHLIAEKLSDQRLDDVTCSGATTQSILTGATTNGTAQPAQIAELSAATKLVTVGIGGNDDGLFSTLVRGCAVVAKQDFTGAPCQSAGATQARSALQDIDTNVDDTIAAIEAKAPDAQIFVVGYPKPLATDGKTCDSVPFAAGDYAFVDHVVAGLSGALKRAAQAHGATYVDVARPSVGHDICSADPWVNGATTSPTGAIAFHPLPAEQQAIADLIAPQVR